MDLQINLAGIIEESIVDGPGIRTVFFTQGCPRRCKGCHNSDTQPFGTGTDKTVQQCCEIAKRNPLVKGITLSGGEPFSQAEALAQLAQRLKIEGYEIAAYTGFTFEQLFNGTKEQQQLLRQCDIIIDGEFILEKRNLNLKFRGSSNQRVVDVAKSFEQGKAVVSTQKRWGAL